MKWNSFVAANNAVENHTYNQAESDQFISCAVIYEALKKINPRISRQTAFRVCGIKGKKMCILGKPVRFYHNSNHYYVHKDDAKAVIEEYQRIADEHDNKDKYLTIEDYALSIGASRRTAERKIKSKELKTVIFDKKTYIEKEALC